jgi:hypothetical protein
MVLRVGREATEPARLILGWLVPDSKLPKSGCHLNPGQILAAGTANGDRRYGVIARPTFRIWAKVEWPGDRNHSGDLNPAQLFMVRGIVATPCLAKFLGQTCG